MHQKDAHCSYCGRRYPPDLAWPRTCGRCKNVAYRNPLPVAVVLVPVGDGLLVVRRGIEPAKGKLALPGGYVDFGETWQQAGAREVFEETGLRLDPAEIADFRVRSSPVGVLVVFGLARKRTRRQLPKFVANPEVAELAVLGGREELAFPLHTDAVADYFARRRKARQSRTRGRKS